MATKANGGGLTTTLASFYSGLGYEDLSPQVVDRAKYFCLDYLGVAIRGSPHPLIQGDSWGAEDLQSQRGFGDHGHLFAGVSGVRRAGQRSGRTQPRDGRRTETTRPRTLLWPPFPRRLHAPTWLEPGETLRWTGEVSSPP